MAEFSSGNEQNQVIFPANRAAHLYQSGTADFTRRADQYFLVFNLYPTNDDFLQSKYDYLKTHRDRLHFLCHTVEGPKFQIQQDVMNQYNRKRIVNRKIDYDPVSVRMYDTIDGLGLRFAKLLYEFEFQNARLYKKTHKDNDNNKTMGKYSFRPENERANYNESIIGTEEQFLSQHNFGLIAKPGHSHRIIKSIDLYQLAGKLYSKARMVHPRLSRFDMDQMDYSSSAVTNVSLSFQYENLVLEEVAVKIQDAEWDLEKAFGESIGGHTGNFRGYNYSGKFADWVRTSGEEFEARNSTPEENKTETRIPLVKPAVQVETSDKDNKNIDMTKDNNKDKSATSKFNISSYKEVDTHISADGLGNNSTVTREMTVEELKAWRKRIADAGPYSDSELSKSIYHKKLASMDNAIEIKEAGGVGKKMGVIVDADGYPVKNVTKKSELDSIKQDREPTIAELKDFRAELVKHGPLIPGDADEITDWEDQIQLIDEKIAIEENNIANPDKVVVWDDDVVF
jgi:hypothetical protein